LSDDPPLDALVPWADFANHAPTCTALFSLTDGAAPAVLTAGAAEMVALRADRLYNAGDEVAASYGAKASAELLVTYGFVPAPGSNPHDFHGLRLQVCHWVNALACITRGHLFGLTIVYTYIQQTPQDLGGHGRPRGATQS